MNAYYSRIGGERQPRDRSHGIQPAKGNSKERNGGEQTGPSRAPECYWPVEEEEQRNQGDERKKG